MSESTVDRNVVNVFIKKFHLKNLVLPRNRFCKSKHLNMSTSGGKFNPGSKKKKKPGWSRRAKGTRGDRYSDRCSYYISRVCLSTSLH